MLMLRTGSVALGLAVMVSACGSDAPPPPPPVAASAPKKKVEAAAPSIVSTVDYSYNPVGKRDPFRSSALDFRVGQADSTETVVCNEPLCQYDLNDLNVVAVVSGDSNPMGMLEDRSGVGHIIHRNSKVGRQGGKVTQILRDCVVITSFITGADGKAQPNKTQMCVRQDKASDPVLDLLDGKLRQ
jgi:type IV pilus assembly protein PilP